MLCAILLRMNSATIKLAARVRRKNDNGMDMPGSVVRVNAVAAMVYWPQDSYYQVVPVAELELYDAIPELVAA